MNAQKKYRESGDKLSIIGTIFQLLSVYRWNLFVGCALQALQSFTGLHIIQYYGPQILIDAGFAHETKNELLSAMIFVFLVMVVATALLIQLSEKHGRRYLILYSTMPMAISCLALGFVVAVNAFSETPGTFEGTVFFTHTH